MLIGGLALLLLNLLVEGLQSQIWATGAYFG